MSVTAEQLHELIDAPATAPYRYGLFSVLSGEPHEGKSTIGITFESLAGATAAVTNDECVDPSRTPYTVTEDCLVREGAPFTVYLYNEDSLGAHESTAAAIAATVGRFSLAEQAAVELEMATRLAVEEASPTAVTLGTEPHIKMRAVLAEVERDLGDLTGAEGVIFMSRFAATLLGDVLVRQNGMLRTPLGNRVAAMAGGNLGSTIYGTGPLAVKRGPVEPISATGGQVTNDSNIIAQRTYALAWDVGTVGATATL